MNVGVLWMWHSDMWKENKCCQLMGGLCARMYYNRTYLLNREGEICRSRFGTKDLEPLGVITYRLLFAFAKITPYFKIWEHGEDETTIRIARFYDKKWWG